MKPTAQRIVGRVEATKGTVEISMPEEAAELLYGLLGRIRRQDGFDPIFQQLHNIGEKQDNGITRANVHLDFVADQVLRVEREDQ